MPCVSLQAAEAASKLVGLTVDYVISSPFKRCLQTSAGLVKSLPGLQEGHWLVDWQLGEVGEGAGTGQTWRGGGGDGWEVVGPGSSAILCGSSSGWVQLWAAQRPGPLVLRLSVYGLVQLACTGEMS